MRKLRKNRLLEVTIVYYPVTRLADITTSECDVGAHLKELLPLVVGRHLVLPLPRPLLRRHVLLAGLERCGTAPTV